MAEKLKKKVSYFQTVLTRIPTLASSPPSSSLLSSQLTNRHFLSACYMSGTALRILRGSDFISKIPRCRFFCSSCMTHIKSQQQRGLCAEWPQRHLHTHTHPSGLPPPYWKGGGSAGHFFGRPPLQAALEPVFYTMTVKCGARSPWLWKRGKTVHPAHTTILYVTNKRRWRHTQRSEPFIYLIKKNSSSSGLPRPPGPFLVSSTK